MSTVGFFDLWQEEWLLTEKVEFDGPNRQIIVHPGISTLNIRNDVYSAWKRWVHLQKNSGYPQAMRVVGGDPVGPGQYAGDIYFLMNSWQIVVGEAIDVTGILYHDDGIKPYKILQGGGVIATVSSLTQLLEVGGGGTGADAASVWSASSFTNAQAGSVGAALRDIYLRLPDVQSTLNLTRTAVNSARTDVAGVAANLAIVDDKVDGIDTKITAVATDLDITQASIASLDTKVTDAAQDVGALQTDITSVLGNLSTATALINTLLKYEKNRTKVDQIAKTLTVYDDDGITPLKVFNLRNFLGQPSVTEVAERSPTS